MPKKLAAGNWKMHGLADDLAQLWAISETARACDVPTLICPPATLIARASATAPALSIGAQTCHPNASGAHTGDLSAAMLKDAGASHVIVGHSERRTDHAETSAQVAAQTRAAWASGLVAVICIGETLAQREAGTTLDVLRAQLHDSTPEGATAATTVIAYEPVWAIGTGLVPSLAQINEVHDALRAELVKITPEASEITLLYGGSVKAGNAADIFSCANVNGALVGGASLTSDDFCPIIEALAAA